MAMRPAVRETSIVPRKPWNRKAQVVGLAKKAQNLGASCPVT